MGNTMDYQRRPSSSEYGDYYQGYIDLVPDANIEQHFHEQMDQVRLVTDSIDESTASQLHAPYTWTIKQVFGHLIDAEKVFGYRMHRFAAADKTKLPGFDHTPYSENLDFEQPLMADLVDELEAARTANGLFMKRLTNEQWDNEGVASGSPCTVRALAYIMVGHINHHLQIVKQRVTE